jgi:benzoylformate decarboxylase
VWRYYPYVSSPVVLASLELLHITNDPYDAAIALISDSLLSNTRLALEGLYPLLQSSVTPPPPEVKPTELSAPTVHVAKKPEVSVMTAADTWAAIAQLRPKDALLV